MSRFTDGSSGIVVPNAVAPLPGDFNHDGTVDDADYVVWRKTDGTQQGYDDWRTHFGQTAGSGAISSAGTAAQRWSARTVPEPASLALDLLTILALAIVRRPRFSLPLSHSPSLVVAASPPSSPLPQGGQKSSLKSAGECATLLNAFAHTIFENSDHGCHG